MKKFIFESEFTKKGRKFKFKKEVEASTENFAKEKLFSIIGSCHKVSRRFIDIKNIEVLHNAKEIGAKSSANPSLN